MENVLRIVREIGSTSSRNDKELILENNQQNLLLKEVLEFVYNPYITTGLSSKKIKKKVRETIKHNIQNVNELMEYIKNHNTGTDRDIAVVQEFISRQTQELQEFYIGMVTKSLKIGVTAKTLNKVYGKGFIPEFNVMLADKYFDHEDKIKGDFIVTTKLDGGRVAIIKENGLINFFTRQGQPINDLVEIHEEAKLLPDNMVYDGELLLRNDKGLDSKDLYRATMKETRKDGIKKNLIFNCFDVIPLNKFKLGICNASCIERKNILHKILSELDLKFIVEVPILYHGSDKNEIIRLLNEAKARNEEGVMVNIADGYNSYYECKRTRNLLKVKTMNDCDLKVISIEEGEGKNKNSLGRINVEYKGNIVGVGSGFTDGMRKEVYNNPNKYIGKIAKIQYFEETTNSKDDKLSLRFPVFVEWREDGKEVSFY